MEPLLFYNWIKKSEEIYFESEEDTAEVNEFFKVENNPFDKSLMEFDEHKREVIMTNNENILYDIQITEAFLILNDLITFKH